MNRHQVTTEPAASRKHWACSMRTLFPRRLRSAGPSMMWSSISWTMNHPMTRARPLRPSWSATASRSSSDPTVPAFPSLLPKFLRKAGSRPSALPAQTRRSHRAIRIISVSASSIRSRAASSRTLQARISAQRRLTALQNSAMTIRRDLFSTSPRLSRLSAAKS